MALTDEQSFLCPYCSSENSLLIDFSAGRNQSFVVDCETCCAPILLRIVCQGTEIISLDARAENE